jgi:hypothetical protein
MATGLGAGTRAPGRSSCRSRRSGRGPTSRASCSPASAQSRRSSRWCSRPRLRRLNAPRRPAFDWGTDWADQRAPAPTLSTSSAPLSGRRSRLSSRRRRSLTPPDWPSPARYPRERWRRSQPPVCRRLICARPWSWDPPAPSSRVAMSLRTFALTAVTALRPRTRRSFTSRPRRSGRASGCICRPCGQTRTPSIPICFTTWTTRSRSPGRCRVCRV